MCGLFGEFSLGAPLLAPITFSRLLHLSRHRGPDAQDTCRLHHRVQLGFNRLAIQDLSPLANQPYTSPSGRFVFVFNGEIYNHRDLRKQYFSQAAFQTHSDTETIAFCFDRWGPKEAVKHLDGMFSLAVYDQHRQSLTLARDFAGIKPLFYGLDSQLLVFASQLDQVCRHPQFCQEALDPESLYLFLRFHYLSAPRGLLRHTYQVEPGLSLTFTGEGTLESCRFWDFPDPPEPFCSQKEEAMAQLQDTLHQSVKSQLICDVPLGAFLSGGIDSPLVTSLALEEINPSAFRTFSLGSDSSIHDESDDIRTYQNLLGVNGSLRHMTASDMAGYLIAAMDAAREPLGDYSLLPTYVVSEMAKRDITVALSGDGGDELFFGYERFWSVLKNLPFYRGPHWWRKGLYWSARLMGQRHRLNEIVLASSLNEAHAGLHSRTGPSVISRAFPHLSQNPRHFPEIYNYQGQTEGQLLQAMRKAEFFGMMQKTLAKVDRASMAHSLEVRVPFLSKPVIELAIQLSPYLSYGPNRKKQLLKDLLQQRLPGAPIDNCKRGFSIPLADWMRKDLFPFFEEELRHLDEVGGRPEVALDLLHQHRLGAAYHWPLFTLTSLVRWRRQCQKSL